MARFLPEAIASVQAQDIRNLEYLVADGGSTDGTVHLLQGYNGHLKWWSRPDGGAADALATAFRSARGEILGWLNADDTYQPQAISGAVNYLQAHPSVSLVYGGFNFIDEKGHVVHTHYPPSFALEKLLYSDIIPNAGMFFRRQIITEIGGINPHLHYVLDWEFVLRIALRYQVAQVSAIWGNFRITSGTKSVEKCDRFWPEIIPILQEITAAPDSC
jgi:glycosyltransferase involved in cell wall biosynthesis